MEQWIFMLLAVVLYGSHGKSCGKYTISVSYKYFKLVWEGEQIPEVV